MATDGAGPAGSELSEWLGQLPAPDLQADPCSADGTQTDYYTVGTVRRLLAAERERWKSLRDKLQADIDRPDGRWGMHGHTAVDDHYFEALEYFVARMGEVLGPNRS